MKDPIKVTKDQLDSICLLGKGAACCSFLVVGPLGMSCAKDTGFDAPLRQRRAGGTIRAMGNNCAGAPECAPLDAAIESAKDLLYA